VPYIPTDAVPENFISTDFHPEKCTTADFQPQNLIALLLTPTPVRALPLRDLLILMTSKTYATTEIIFMCNKLFFFFSLLDFFHYFFADNMVSKPVLNFCCEYKYLYFLILFLSFLLSLMLNPRHLRLSIQNDLDEHRVMRKQKEKYKHDHDKYYQYWGIKLNNPNFKEIYEIDEKLRTYRKRAYVVTHWSATPPYDTVLIGIIVLKLPQSVH
jgi:hypothetical protein